MSIGAPCAAATLLPPSNGGIERKFIEFDFSLVYTLFLEKWTLLLKLLLLVPNQHLLLAKKGFLCLLKTFQAKRSPDFLPGSFCSEFNLAIQNGVKSILKENFFIQCSLSIFTCYVFNFSSIVVKLKYYKTDQWLSQSLMINSSLIYRISANSF